MIIYRATAVSALVAVLALPALAPTAAATTALPESPSATGATPPETLAAAAVNCNNKSQAAIAKTYHRGPATVHLRCGTKSWGFRHLVAKGRWNATFDKKINRTVWSGTITTNLPGQRIYDDMRLACPAKSEFKVVTNPGPMGANPAVNPQGIITAYKPTTAAAASSAC
ncbi:hypothetical protein ACLGI4_20975 [Streptomyces sp. HMX112]|uniref:hypothetical protein n=1 Tax=Streptomyces sp. HMX112 TaxID=3390850 RepID=UPI003A7F946D